MEKRVRLGQLVWENKLDYTAIYLVRPRQKGDGAVLVWAAPELAPLSVGKGKVSKRRELLIEVASPDDPGPLAVAKRALGLTVD